MHVRLGNLALLILISGLITSCSPQRGASTANLPKPSERMTPLIQEGAVPKDVLRIGSWNTAWLGPSNHTPAERRTPEDLAQYIARSGAGIISLQLVGETPGSPAKMPRSTASSASSSAKARATGLHPLPLAISRPQRLHRHPLEQASGLAGRAALRHSRASKPKGPGRHVALGTSSLCDEILHRPN